MFDVADRTTTTGVANLKSKLAQAIMGQCNQRVKEILDYAELTCNEIFRKDGTHDDFMLNLFSSMETSDATTFLVLVTKKRRE